MKNYRVTPCASTHNEGIKWFTSPGKGTSATMRTKGPGGTSVHDGPQPYSHTVAAKSAPRERTKTMWSRSPFVASREGAEDFQQVYYENKLGCARGVIWAVAFQISVIVAAAICWELYTLLR
jgi:hypothetical protein